MNTAIGIDLGGTNIKGVLIDDTGNILHQLNRPTQDDRNEQGSDGSNWKAAVKETIAELEQGHPQLTAIGLSAPGIANKDHSAIASMPGRLYGLDHFHWGNFLGKRRVPVLNDADAALIAESMYGAGKGYQHIFMLTLGTGLGGGLWLNGKLYQGFMQRAGHLGHISLDSHSEERSVAGIPGALELKVGDVSIKKRSFGRYQSTHELIKAYEAEDTFATYLWLEAVKNLAVGISSLINVISPEIVILGGGISKAGASLFEPLREFMKIYKWEAITVNTPILPATFNDYAGAIGAATYALQEITT